MAPRFIHFTYDYMHKSAGCRVIHYYVHLMRKCGFDSYISSDKTNPNWNTPKFTGAITDNDIVIYPECIQNTNPFNAKNIVRYMLYFPTAFYGGHRISSNEFLMPYEDYLYDESERYYDGKLTREDMLFLPSVEGDLFKPETKFIESAYYVGKGAKNLDMKRIPPQAVCITSTWPETRTDVAALLNITKNFYSFDPFTALLPEARLSGCNTYILEKDLPDRVYDAPVVHIMDEERDAKEVERVAHRILKFFRFEN